MSSFDKMNLEGDEATVPGHDDGYLAVNIPLLSNGESESHLSLSSINSKTKSTQDMCRICHCEETADERLISPCQCLGTMQYLHQSCLQRWIKISGVKSCELCKFQFIMHSEIKPFKHWQKLDMNIVERRKVMCSVAFNLIAVTCIIWSLYVLIDKTRQEIQSGKLQWPFWTKIIVVAIGFTGGLVFLYVQCKMYIQLCFRWRQFNQRIVIHSYSERQNDISMTDHIQTKSSSPWSQNNKGIITVLDANDLVPSNMNHSSIRTSNDDVNGLSLTTSNDHPIRNDRNRRQNPRLNQRNFFQKLFTFNRSS